MEAVSEFLDTIYYGEAELIYHGHRYFINGARYLREKGSMCLDVYLLYEDPSKLARTLFETCQPTAEACLQAFLAAPIWDGRTFREAEAEMQWV